MWGFLRLCSFGLFVLAYDKTIDHEMMSLFAEAVSNKSMEGITADLFPTLLMVRYPPIADSLLSIGLALSHWRLLQGKHVVLGAGGELVEELIVGSGNKGIRMLTRASGFKCRNNFFDLQVRSTPPFRAHA